ncbi:metallophosphoesterase [Salinimonas marina]|uniref:Metallophosphoesterase n=1 Tax=Salinimonas marina TaxID=2785918 RepID=A0A7S9DWT2_9ALTE|nr:metallophosphoesterase [Salinimonas marina]QPG05295.1 metallophosphoesterase [Salinimonas marina]
MSEPSALCHQQSLMGAAQRLVQFTDCHLFADPEQSGYAAIAPYHSLARCLESAVEYQPDMLLCTGDISGDDSKTSYVWLRELIKQYAPHIPLYVIAGNHDNNPYFKETLAAHAIQSGAPAELGNWCVHGLDTRYQGAQGQIDERQLQQVAAAIGARPRQYHALALHHHPIASNSWMDTHCLVNAGVLLDWLHTQPVRVVLHGHTHAECEHAHGRQTILGTPSTSWQWAMTPEFGVSAQPPGFRLLELSDEGHWHSIIRRIS